MTSQSEKETSVGGKIETVPCGKSVPKTDSLEVSKGTKSGQYKLEMLYKEGSVKILSL